MFLIVEQEELLRGVAVPGSFPAEVAQEGVFPVEEIVMDFLAEVAVLAEVVQEARGKYYEMVIF